MRHILGIFLLAFALLTSPPATAGSSGVHITTGTTNITTSFQLFLTIQTAAKDLYVFNGCGGTIAISFSNVSPNIVPAASTTTNPQQLFFGPTLTNSASIVTLPRAVGGKYVWVRSDSGSACSSGDVDINAW